MNEITKVVTDVSHYNEIAKALQDNGAYSLSYKPSDMATGIRDVCEYRYQSGYESGEAQGLIDGEAVGRQAQYEEFWDSFQHEGTRDNYMCAFGVVWNKDTFKPLHKIVPSGVNGARMMFYCFGASETEPLDYRTVSHMIDLSQVTQAYFTFYSAKINHIDVDLSNCTTIQGAFSCEWNRTGRTDLKLKVSEKCTNYAGAFSFCSELINLEFKEGSVIAADINVSHCNLLTHDSLMSIINALKDYSGTATTRTLTLHTNSLALLESTDEGSAALAYARDTKGWTITT